VRSGPVNVAGAEGGCKAAADAASRLRERGSPQSVETLHKPARPHTRRLAARPAGGGVGAVTFAEIFAGIRGASVAWDALGWECRWVAETDAFASAVGAYHHGAPNLGDVNEIRRETAEPIDILIGGPPCQDFSVAGKREGMAGGRGSLVWQYLRVADELRPRWLVFENVPGLLSSANGRDFGAFLGALAERGYMGCYRVLDAQYFGVPQRRRRVFAVCYFGDWRPAAAALLERESLCWNPAPSREAREEVARPIASRTGNCSQDESRESFVVNANSTPEVSHGIAFPLRADDGSGNRQAIAFSCKDNGRDVGEVSPPLRAMGHDQSHPNAGGQVAVAFDTQQTPKFSVDCARPLTAISPSGGGQPQAVAFALNAKGGQGRMDVESDTLIPTLRAGKNETGGDRPPGTDVDTAESLQVVAFMAVRRLTPRECERLQGFPDDYTQIPWRGKPRDQCPDGPRYRVLGNAFPVPVVRWIGERIAMLEATQ